MENEYLKLIAAKIDQLGSRSRLAEVDMFMSVGPTQRIGSLMEGVALLPPGPYIVGCGPYCCDIMKVSVDKVTIGRSATASEEPADIVADMLVNDTCWLRPREVSRIHASVTRHGSGGAARYYLLDEGSTTGTFLNGRQLANYPEQDQRDNPVELTSGDYFTLGSSGINHFVFLAIQNRS